MPDTKRGREEKGLKKLEQTEAMLIEAEIDETEAGVYETAQYDELREPTDEELPD